MMLPDSGLLFWATLFKHLLEAFNVLGLLMNFYLNKSYINSNGNSQVTTIKQ